MNVTKVETLCREIRVRSFSRFEDDDAETEEFNRKHLNELWQELKDALCDIDIDEVFDVERGFNKNWVIYAKHEIGNIILKIIYNKKPERINSNKWCIFCEDDELIYFYKKGQMKFGIS